MDRPALISFISGLNKLVYWTDFRPSWWPLCNRDDLAELMFVIFRGILLDSHREPDGAHHTEISQHLKKFGCMPRLTPFFAFRL